MKNVEQLLCDIHQNGGLLLTGLEDGLTLIMIIRQATTKIKDDMLIISDHGHHIHGIRMVDI